MGYVEEYYKKWLLDRVLVDCWTTLKCSKVLGRSLKKVNADLKRFLDEVKMG